MLIIYFKKLQIEMGIEMSYMNEKIDLNEYIAKLMNIVVQNSINVEKEKVCFMDGRYQAIYSVQKGFQNIFKAFDNLSNGKENCFKYIKTYQLKNQQNLITAMEEKLQFFIDKLNDINSITKINRFYVENNKRGKIARLIILEEFNEFITLKDFLECIYHDFIKDRINIEIVILFLINRVAYI
jgi:hypothetical protein